MKPIGTFVPTQRVFRGPDVDLVEMMDTTDGTIATALVYPPPLRSHPALSSEFQTARPLVEAGSVRGLAELEAIDPEQGAFVFSTDVVWSVAEVLEWRRLNGRQPNVRAGLQLCRVGAMILLDAADTGAPHGVYAHGNIDPLRVLLQADGEMMLAGYGLRWVPMLHDSQPDPAHWAYSPPERFAGAPEDIFSDLFSLTLVGLEWMLGEPVYEGSVDDVVAQARRGTAKDRLYRLRRVLPRVVVDVLSEAVDVHPDSRHEHPEDYIRLVGGVIGSPQVPGSSLAEEMAAIASSWSREHPLPAVDEPEPKSRLTASGNRARPRRRRRSERRHELEAPRDRNTMFPRRPMGRTRRYEISVQGARPRRARLDPEQPLAESTARLVDHLCPTPVDASGRIVGWYRVWQDDDAWYGDARTAVLDPDALIELEFVDNRVVPMRFALEDREGTEIIEADVGVAVHAQFLLAWLRREHGLSSRSWTLAVGDHPLDPWQILDDYEPESGFEVRVIRQRRLRRPSR